MARRRLAVKPPDRRARDPPDEGWRRPPGSPWWEETPDPEPFIRLPALLMPFATPAIHLAARLVRPMTLGARVAAIDAGGAVLLVKHSYLKGWHLPGGGVEPGETLEEAARRETLEETGVAIAGPLALHGMFFNRQASRRDHVAVFVARDVERPASLPGPDLEIAERRFFPLEALPDDLARATRARLDEIAGRTPRSADW